MYIIYDDNAIVIQTLLTCKTQHPYVLSPHWTSNILWTQHHKNPYSKSLLIVIDSIHTVMASIISFRKFGMVEDAGGVKRRETGENIEGKCHWEDRWFRFWHIAHHEKCGKSNYESYLSPNIKELCSQNRYICITFISPYLFYYFRKKWNIKCRWLISNIHHRILFFIKLIIMSISSFVFKFEIHIVLWL